MTVGLNSRIEPASPSWWTYSRNIDASVRNPRPCRLLSLMRGRDAKVVEERPEFGDDLVVGMPGP